MSSERAHFDFRWHEKKNALEELQKLVPYIIRDSRTECLLRIAPKNGKACFIVLDGSKLPDYGDLALVEAVKGYKVVRMGHYAPCQIVGKVMWVLHEG